MLVIGNHELYTFIYREFNRLISEGKIIKTEFKGEYIQSIHTFTDNKEKGGDGILRTPNMDGIYLVRDILIEFAQNKIPLGRLDDSLTMADISRVSFRNGKFELDVFDGEYTNNDNVLIISDVPKDEPIVKQIKDWHIKHQENLSQLKPTNEVEVNIINALAELGAIVMNSKGVYDGNPSTATESNEG